MISSEEFVSSLVDFPKFVLGVLSGILHAILTDLDTFVLTVGIGILALAISPALAIGAGLIIYVIVRIFSTQVGFLSAVIRDNAQNLAVRITNE